MIDISAFTKKELDEGLKGSCDILRDPFIVGDYISKEEMPSILNEIDKRCVHYPSNGQAIQQKKINAYRGELVEYILRKRFPNQFFDARISTDEEKGNPCSDLSFEHRLIIECKTSLYGNIHNYQSEFLLETNGTPNRPGNYKKLQFNYSLWFVRKVEYDLYKDDGFYYTTDILKMSYYLYGVRNNIHTDLWK